MEMWKISHIYVPDYAIYTKNARISGRSTHYRILFIIRMIYMIFHVILAFFFKGRYTDSHNGYTYDNKEAHPWIFGS